jgi:formylmethanofuran dehydrogenase subunit E
MKAYQSMRDDEMFTVTPVTLNTSIAAIVSRPGMRVNCGLCGEEIMNEREIKTDGITLCQACARGAYYQAAKHENTPPRDIQQTATP